MFVALRKGIPGELLAKNLAQLGMMWNVFPPKVVGTGTAEGQKKNLQIWEIQQTNKELKGTYSKIMKKLN